MSFHSLVPSVVLTALALGLGAATAQLGLTLGPSGTLDALVADAPDDEALRVAALRTSMGDTVTALEVTRDAAGLRLTGRLPDLADSPLLHPITTEDAWPCPPRVSDPAARFAPTEVLVEGLGVLRPGLQPPLAGETPVGHVMLVLVFADRRVHVEVDCAPDAEGGAPVLRAAFTLEQGWNVLAGSALVGDDAAQHVTLRQAEPSELEAGRWYAPPPELVTPLAPPRLDQAPGDRRDDGPPVPPTPPGRQD
jgi:hypothetical protein